MYLCLKVSLRNNLFIKRTTLQIGSRHIVSVFMSGVSTLPREAGRPELCVNDASVRVGWLVSAMVVSTVINTITISLVSFFEAKVGVSQHSSSMIHITTHYKLKQLQQNN